MAQANLPHVLVVDDDPAMATLVVRAVEAAGHRVLTARDGAEAMQIMLEDGPPLLITDWLMPGMDGLELCRTIRAHEGVRFAYIVVLTAYTDEDRVVEAFEAGADDLLSKPLNRRELLARLRAGVRMIRLQQDLDRKNREVHRVNAKMAVAHAKLARANETLNRMATTDELTGLTNRREALRCLDEAWASADRHDEPLACITLDIDHFKLVNDQFGHAVGDVVLKETADTLNAMTRRGERVCRIGGEEFLVVCAKSTESMAATAAERLREAVRGHVVYSGSHRLRVAISLGVAERTPEMRGPSDLLKAGDDALYAAKDSGRDRVYRASENSARAVESGRCAMHGAGAVVRSADDMDETSERVLLVGHEPGPIAPS